MDRRRNYCNSCTNDTWHEITGRTELVRTDAFFGEDQKFEAQILRCCGCDLLCFRRVTHPFAFQDENDKPLEEFFPVPGHKNRKRKYFASMPGAVRTLYSETVAAHDNKLVLLSAVGLRALIEVIVVDKVARTKYGFSLESKINALADVVDEKVLATLHDFRTVGNEAVHAQVVPDGLDIHRALHLAESLMEYFYGLADGADL